MDYVGKRWTVLIILEMWKEGESEWKRFGEIKDAMRDITPKMLSLRLKELENEGLLVKRADLSSFPAKSEYKLTDAGIELAEFMKQIKFWALKWKILDPVCLTRDCRHCQL